jgi:hypothetical protein
VALEIRQLIRAMSLANPLGRSRIHGELLELGIDVGQTRSPNIWQGTGGPDRRLEDVPSQPRRWEAARKAKTWPSVKIGKRHFAGSHVQCAPPTLH